MKYLLTILFTFTFVLTSFSMPDDTVKTESVSKAAITAEEVIENYINAIGGKDNLLSVTDRSTRMKAEMSGIKVDVSLYQKAPNKLYQVVSAPGFEQKTIFNGEKGYQITQMGEMEVTGNELQLMKNEASLYLITDLKSYGITAGYSEEIQINDKPAHKIIFTDEANNTWYHIFDAETYLKLRDEKEVSTEMGTFKNIIDYDDYREVDGIKFPFKIKQSIAGQSIQYEVTSLKVNTGLSDNIFEKKEE